MTEELFRNDSYLRECDAVVTGAAEHGITLDRTVFYPLGGGQPGDSGRDRLGRLLRVYGDPGVVEHPAVAVAQFAGVDRGIDFLEGGPAGKRKLLVCYRAAQNGQKSLIHIPPVP